MSRFFFKIYGFKYPLLFCTFSAIVVVLSGCGLLDTTYRYRLTVNVEVAGKIYSGTTVQQTIFHEQALPTIDTSSERSLGEAVVVDVGRRGYLFLLENLSLDGLVEHQGINRRFTYEKSWNISEEWLAKFPFATFTDINNPRTAKEVHPFEYEYYELKNYPNNQQESIKRIGKPNFQEIFGSDAKLVSVTVTPTREPITWGQVEKVIPWIRDDINSYNKNTRGLYFCSDKTNYIPNSFYSNICSTFFIRNI